MVSMKNPLRKRLPRALVGELGKYIVIFLLLAGTIGFVSGFLVADDSILNAYYNGFSTYNIEDGNFTLEEALSDAQWAALEDEGVTLYENFYAEEALTNDTTLRIFANRTEVDLPCVMEGALPAAAGEIAIDRMYAENNGIAVGDTIFSDERSWTVCGLVALSDYNALFSNNNDTMFDAVKFGVAVVTAEDFADFAEKELSFTYAWKYATAPESTAEEKEAADAFLKVVAANATLTSFIPCYLNQSIQYSGDDLGKDRMMMVILLYILIVIFAFVFGITTKSTITKEAGVIGTLLASGYRKGEILRHYLVLPVFVTAVAALAGNVLGYTVMKDAMASLYYNSYSLGTYETLWNADAFWQTTLVPVLLMLAVNVLVLRRALSLSPLNFLRREFRRRGRKRVLPLSPAIRFFTRFRLRVLFSNIGSFGILFVGILFANLLLFFGMLLPFVVSNYQEQIADNLFCEYQYMLNVPASVTAAEGDAQLLALYTYAQAVETETDGAEKFSVYTLQTGEDAISDEEIILYGVEEESAYVPLSLDDDDVYVSAAYAEKFRLAVGDTIVLEEKYEDASYEFTITGIWDYWGSLSVYMTRSALNETFDLSEEYFGGYFSDVEITDIDDAYIASVIDLDTMTKVSRQLTVSMGDMMGVIDAFAVIMFLVLMYLLARLMTEKNARAISMAKILGYTHREIAALYMMPTTVAVVVLLLVSYPLEYVIMQQIYRVLMESMNGWIRFTMAPIIWVKMFALGLGAYCIVAFLEYRRIGRVPMDEALKNNE